MSNMKNMSNRQNILNMDKLSLKSNLVHKIVYLALCSLLLVLGVTKDGSSSSSVSSACAGPSRRTRSRLPSPGWRPPPQCPAPPPQHPRTAPPPPHPPTAPPHPPHPGGLRGERWGLGAGWTVWMHRSARRAGYPSDSSRRLTAAGARTSRPQPP